MIYSRAALSSYPFLRGHSTLAPHTPWIYHLLRNSCYKALTGVSVALTSSCHKIKGWYKITRFRLKSVTIVESWCNQRFFFRLLYETLILDHSTCFVEKKAVVDWHTLSRDMWFPTMWHFDKCKLRRPVQPPFKLRNSKWCPVSSLALIEHSND